MHEQSEGDALCIRAVARSCDEDRALPRGETRVILEVA